MKRNLQRGEWWPVFMLTEPHRTDDPEDIIEVHDDLIAEYEAASLAFNKVQDKLRTLWENSNP